jgi:hypothetical protein
LDIGFSKIKSKLTWPIQWMNPFKKTSLCLAVAMAWSVAVLAGNATPLNNPYLPIVTRNAFVLNPTVLPAASAPAEPLPVITPNGIISIFGNVQVLFKVTDNPPNQPAREKAYIFNEGQRVDAIAVIKIDEKNAVITFDNHGIIQQVPLAIGTASGGLETAPGLTGQTNLGGLPHRSHFRGSAALAFKNRVPDNNGNIPNPSDVGVGYGGGSDDNNPADQGLKVSYGGSPDNNNVSIQDPNLSNGRGLDQNNLADQRPNISVAEHLANLQMIMFAKQRMQ